MNEDTSYLFTIIGSFHILGIFILYKVTSKLYKDNKENIKLIDNSEFFFLQ